MRVLCNNSECIFFQPLPEGRIQNLSRSGRPWDWDKYTGLCTREEIGVKVRVIETRDTKYVLPECRTFSNKGFSGHLDFSRFPKGGHIDAETSRELSREEKIRKESAHGKLYY